jgi:hypothetical protein
LSKTGRKLRDQQVIMQITVQNNTAVVSNGDLNDYLSIVGSKAGCPSSGKHSLTCGRKILNKLPAATRTTTFPVYKFSYKSKLCVSKEKNNPIIYAGTEKWHRSSSTRFNLDA